MKMTRLTVGLVLALTTAALTASAYGDVVLWDGETRNLDGDTGVPLFRGGTRAVNVYGLAIDVLAQGVNVSPSTLSASITRRISAFQSGYKPDGIPVPGIEITLQAHPNAPVDLYSATHRVTVAVPGGQRWFTVRVECPQSAWTWDTLPHVKSLNAAKNSVLVGEMTAATVTLDRPAWCSGTRVGLMLGNGTILADPRAALAFPDVPKRNEEILIPEGQQQLSFRVQGQQALNQQGWNAVCVRILTGPSNLESRDVAKCVHVTVTSSPPASTPALRPADPGQLQVPPSQRPRR